jgi:hypothetical protein
MLGRTGMVDDKISFFSGTPRERVIVGLTAPVLALVCAWCFLMSRSALTDGGLASPGSHFILGVFRFLCMELFSAAFIFLLLAFVWAVLRPLWIVRFMVTVSHHVWRAVCLVVLTIFLTALIASLIAHAA